MLIVSTPRYFLDAGVITVKATRRVRGLGRSGWSGGGEVRYPTINSGTAGTGTIERSSLGKAGRRGWGEGWHQGLFIGDALSFE
jgi:hypothetical protein